MYSADRYVGIGLVLLGLLAWLLTLRFPTSGGLVEPSSLPRLIATLLVVLGIVVAWRAQRALRAHEAHSLTWRPGFRSRVIAAFASVAVFVALLENVPALGFPLLAPPLMIVLGRLFGGRSWWAIVLVSIAVSEGAYFFFHTWLGLVLPRSLWF